MKGRRRGRVGQLQGPIPGQPHPSLHRIRRAWGGLGVDGPASLTRILHRRRHDDRRTDVPPLNNAPGISGRFQPPIYPLALLLRPSQANIPLSGRRPESESVMYPRRYSRASNINNRRRRRPVLACTSSGGIRVPLPSRARPRLLRPAPNGRTLLSTNPTAETPRPPRSPTASRPSHPSEKPCAPPRPSSSKRCPNPLQRRSRPTRRTVAWPVLPEE